MAEECGMQIITSWRMLKNLTHEALKHQTSKFQQIADRKRCKGAKQLMSQFQSNQNKQE